MTLCAYLSPQNPKNTAFTEFPVVITDCMVTAENVINPLTPANAHGFKIPADVAMANLTSKYFFLDDMSVISFAGGLKPILEFMDEFPDFFSVKRDKTRPMKYAGQAIDMFNGSRNGPSISALGCAVIRGEKGYGFNNFSKDTDTYDVKTEFFGTCHAIGSGAEQFLDWVRAADRDISKHPSKAFRDNKLARIIGLVGGLNGKKLFELDFSSLSSSWGGYAQVLWFSAPDGRWSHLGNWMYFRAIVTSLKPFKFGWVPKVIRYRTDPDPSGESSLFVTLVGPDHFQSYVWKISSPFREQQSDKSNFEQEQLKIEEFQPDFVNLSIDVRNVKGFSANTIYRTLDPTEMLQFDWRLTRGQPVFPISGEFIKKMVFEALG